MSVRFGCEVIEKKDILALGFELQSLAFVPFCRDQFT